jgi:Carbohydrate binding domain/PEP-CTERM motif
MRLRCVGLLVALFAFSTASGWASLITITNSSFEGPVIAAGFSAPATGWTIGGAGLAGAMTPGSGVLGAENGSQYLYINDGTESQVLAATLQANSTYTLSVWVGLRNDAPCVAFPCVLSGTTIQLFAGSTLLATATGAPPDPGTWSEYQGTVVTGSSDPSLGQALKIVLSASAAQTEFDNVTLNQSSNVPEPSAIFLFATGLVGLIARRRMTR